jgi:hypothetical protein
MGGQSENIIAVISLRRKRAEVAGRIDALGTEANELRQDLIHLDAVLHIFDPEGSPLNHKRKRIVRTSGYFKRGEIPTAILNALRKAGRPMTIRELMPVVMAGKVLPESKAMERTVQLRVLQNLKGLQKRGAVERSMSGNATIWRVKD